MGDDLSQFFAKKAAKTKDKKKKLKVNLDEVGEVLERKAKRQEERDRETEENEKVVQEETNPERRAEESEWFEYKDADKEISLEELGIRDMNLTEQVEEALEEEKATTNEAPRTWNTAEVKETSEEIMVVPQAPAAPQKYVVRQKQQAALKRTGVVPNVYDHDMFPTFADAEKMEKMNKDVEKKKKNDGFTVVTSERESRASTGATANAWETRRTATAAGDRGAVLAAVRQVTSSGAPNPVPPKQQPVQSGPGKYVPPHLRRKV